MRHTTRQRQAAAVFERPAGPPAQETVLLRRQAVELYGAAQVRRNLTRGTWRSPFRQVVVTHNAAMSSREFALAALLSCPPGSALGGWSALAFDGMTGLDQRRPWVLIKDGARRSDRPGVLITHSAALGDDDVWPDRSPRRTRPARSLADAAGAAATPAAARLLLVRGQQQGLVTPQQLGLVLPTRGQCHHLAVMQETVLDLEGGIRSLPEREFARLVRQAGLPDPVRQAVVAGEDGRFYLDADWPEVGLSAEVHGRHHREAETQERDWVRHNALTVGGRSVLYFSSFAVRRDKPMVLSTLSTAWAAFTERQAG